MQQETILIITILVNVFLSNVDNPIGQKRYGWTWTMLTHFFNSKNLHSVDVFLCDSTEAVKLMRHMKWQDLPDGAIFWRVLKNWPVNETHDERVGIFLDSSCRRNQKLLKESNKKWFDLVYSWLIWYPSEQMYVGNVTNLMESLSFFSDVVIISYADFYQVTKFSKTAPIQMTRIGCWEEERNLLTIDFPLITPNLHKSSLVGALFAVQDIYNTSNITAQMLDRNFKHGWDSGNRFFYELSLGLSDLYNFSVEIKKAFDWGRKINGTWTGIIRQLELGISDFALTPMLPFSERLEKSLATPSVQKYWFAVIFKQPRALGTYKALILELDVAVWAVVGFFLLIGGLVLTLILHHGDRKCGTFEVGFFQNIGIFTDQGFTVIVPKTTSAQIASLASLVVGMMVSIYYSSATMTALLSEAPPTIKTLDDFINSDMKINIINATYITRREARVKTLKPGLFERVEKQHAIYEIDGGLKMVRQGQAFCGEYYILFEGIEKTFTDEEKCTLTIIPSHVIFTGMRFVRKDSKHVLELFSRGLIKSYERGLVTKGRDDWIHGPPRCFRSTPFTQVKLESVSVAFGVLSLGMILSMMFFLLEILHERKKYSRIRLFIK